MKRQICWASMAETGVWCKKVHQRYDVISLNKVVVALFIGLLVYLLFSRL